MLAAAIKSFEKNTCCVYINPDSDKAVRCAYSARFRPAEATHPGPELTRERCASRGGASVSERFRLFSPLFAAL